MSDYPARLAAIRERVERAVGRAGRPAAEVRLLLATKQQPAPVIDEVLAAAQGEALLGEVLLGESRVQEYAAKAAGLAALDAQVHFIGQLQRNKINQLLAVEPQVACVQTLDNLRLAEALSQRLSPGPAGERGRDRLPVMIQVNVSGEASKAGVAPDAAVDLALAVAGLPGLEVVGFMTIGLHSDSEPLVRAGYAALRAIRDEAVASLPGATELSMGMSGDLEWAIAEGATLVRVGAAAFGARR
ncbi:MAG: YggS family pyridoxal phosphate-dependent enzyme [Promicromonosporaceae bacterium]|nr:YggS family pyridoxal phosphate-dependent enzyme [Promicromonosporaceae bacterium]